MSQLHSESINEISTALSKAQGEFRSASKDSLNPHFKSRFASLASHWDVCREILAKYNLSITQLADIRDDGKQVLVTILSHSSGQWFKSSLGLNPIKNDPQGMGSCITYARRYLMSAIIGTTADEDDDGVAASKEAKKVETIDAAQAVELERVLGLCGPDYRSKVLDHLSRDPFNVNKIVEIPKNLYDKIYKAAIKKLDETIASSSKEELVDE